jgi:hypothetical protein
MVRWIGYAVCCMASRFVEETNLQTCGVVCCVVLERVRMSEGKQQGQFINHPSLTPEYPAPPKSHRCQRTS